MHHCFYWDVYWCLLPSRYQKYKENSLQVCSTKVNPRQVLTPLPEPFLQWSGHRRLPGGRSKERIEAINYQKNWKRKLRPGRDPRTPQAPHKLSCFVTLNEHYPRGSLRVRTYVPCVSWLDYFFSAGNHQFNSHGREIHRRQVSLQQ